MLTKQKEIPKITNQAEAVDDQRIVRIPEKIFPYLAGAVGGLLDSR